MQQASKSTVLLSGRTRPDECARLSKTRKLFRHLLAQRSTQRTNALFVLKVCKLQKGNGTSKRQNFHHKSPVTLEGSAARVKAHNVHMLENAAYHDALLDRRGSKGLVHPSGNRCDTNKHRTHSARAKKIWKKQARNGAADPWVHLPSDNDP